MTDPATMKALAERLRADTLLYNRGPNYEPLRCKPSAINLEAATALEAAAAEIERLRGGVEIARWKRDSELLDAIQSECWDVRFTDSPNADAGDYNVNIEIVGHFMADPKERVVGEIYNEDLRAALEQAMTAEPYPPARPVYDDRARAALQPKEQT